MKKKKSQQPRNEQEKKRKGNKMRKKKSPRGEKEGKDKKMTKEPKKRKTTKQGARYRATQICHEGGRRQNHSLDVLKLAGPFVQPRPPTPPEARTKRTLGSTAFTGNMGNPYARKVAPRWPYKASKMSQDGIWGPCKVQNDRTWTPK